VVEAPSVRGSSCFARRKGLREDGVEQSTAGIVAAREAGLQLVAEGHQLIDLRDDAVLLGERGHGEWQAFKFGALDALGGETSRDLLQNRLKWF
jgi:hypothetical protein